MKPRTPLILGVGIFTLVIALYFSWHGLNNLMFKKNTDYTIRHVNISTQKEISADELRANSKIKEGENIFSFSSSQKRKELLRNFPNLSEIKIEKTLPDTVTITAFDRIPVLRISDPKARYDVTTFALDHEGTIMQFLPEQQSQRREIPVLVNGNAVIHTVPGDNLVETNSKYKTALLLVNKFNEMEGIPFQISAIDVSGKTYLILETSGFTREIRFVWEELETEEDVHTALQMVSMALIQPKAASRRCFDVNLTTQRVYAK